MQNLRIIYDNAADRATLSSSDTVASLDVANLKSNIKSRVCRSTGKSMTIAASWASPEVVSGVALPFCNLSPSATMRVRLSNEAAATNLLTYSENLNDASWEKIGANLFGGVAAPDGTTNGWGFRSTSTDPYFDKTVTLTPGTYVFSIYLQGVGSTIGKAPNVWVWNLGNFTGFSSVSDARALTSGWVRYKATCVVGQAGQYRIRVDAPDVAAVNDTVNVFGAQVEVGNLTSYYPTTTSPRTRPAGYMDNWQSYSYDSGVFTPCPAGSYPANQKTGVNNFAYGGARCATHWLSARVTCTGVQVAVVENDANTPYIEAGRLVIGDYWEPVDGAETGATLTLADSSKHYRTEAGDMLTDVSSRYRKQSLSMPSLNPADREKMWDILWTSGMGTPVFLSTYPKNGNARLEHTHQMLGKLVTVPVMSTPYFNYNSATVDIEEI